MSIYSANQLRTLKLTYAILSGAYAIKQFVKEKQKYFFVNFCSFLMFKNSLGEIIIY